MAVYLGYATEDFHALVDCDLYLPEETWAQDAQRRAEAGIPEELTFRTQGEIALDLLRRTVAAGAAFKYLTADELHGSSSEFRAGVAQLGITDVVEVGRMTSGWTLEPRFKLPRSKPGGRPRTQLKRPPGTPAEARFWPSHRGQCLTECWLLVARSVMTCEMKYFLSNAPADAPLETLLHVAFSRAEVEQLFEASKGEIGLDHFEVRHYLPLVRHLIVSLASLLFLEEQTQRLEKKLLVEREPGARGA